MEVLELVFSCRLSDNSLVTGSVLRMDWLKKTTVLMLVFWVERWFDDSSCVVARGSMFLLCTVKNRIRRLQKDLWDFGIYEMARVFDLMRWGTIKEYTILVKFFIKNEVGNLISETVGHKKTFGETINLRRKRIWRS